MQDPILILANWLQARARVTRVPLKWHAGLAPTLGQPRHLLPGARLYYCPPLWLRGESLAQRSWELQPFELQGVLPFLVV